MKTFKGLSLLPADAFQNIAVMIHASLIIAVTDLEDSSDLSDCILLQAKMYAEAAHDAALENQK